MRYLLPLIIAASLTACAAPLPQNPAVLGMTPEQVTTQTNWGHPTHVNRTITAAGVREQWVYRNAANRSQYLYFVNGKLTAIQN